jgi:predicted secreted protein
MNAMKLVCLCFACALFGCKSTPSPVPTESGSSMPSSSPEAVAVAPSAASSTASSASAAGTVPTYGETTRELTTAVGQSFVLALPANITTPYRWVVDSTLDSSALELVKNEYSDAPAAGCSGCLGAGGRRLLTFQAKRTGTWTLSLSYQSITDSKEAPVSRFQATVQVTP